MITLQIMRKKKIDMFIIEMISLDVTISRYTQCTVMMMMMNI